MHRQRWTPATRLLVWIGLLSGVGCAPDGGPIRPHILLVSLDTVRPDRLGSYVPGVNDTPTLDRLAAEGLRFENAFSSSPWTLPGHASMLSGQPVSFHGARYDPGGDVGISWHRVALPGADVPLLPELLSAAGYYTAGAIAVVWLQPRFGLARGYDHYVADVVDALGEPADRMTDRALRLIEGRPPEAPFFLFLHYFDAHSPYTPPDPYRPEGVDHDGSIAKVELRVNSGAGRVSEAERRDLLSLYDGEIRFIDAQLGRVVERLERDGIYDDTWIIVTADHGESFGAHDFFGHGLVTWNDVIRVPLIMKPPASRPQRGVVDTPVQPRELVTTVLAELGLEKPAGMDGRNLLRRRFGRLRDDPVPVVAEAYRNLSMIRRFGSRWDRDERAWYEGSEKIVVRSDGSVDLFDWKNDPHETTSHVAGNLDRYDVLRNDLDAWVAHAVQAGVQGRAARITPEDSLSLRALGYLD